MPQSNATTQPNTARPQSPQYPNARPAPSRAPEKAVPQTPAPQPAAPKADRPKVPGKTFNVKSVSGTKPDGKKLWQSHGRVFVRDDLSGGAAWLGPKDEETQYELLPKDMKKQSGGQMFELFEKTKHEDTVVMAPYGRLYIREGMTGGVLWIGEGDAETELAVFPRTKWGGEPPANDDAF